MNARPHILVFGAGAVGCYLGGALGRSGHNVTLLGRSSLADAVTRRALRIREPDGESQVEVRVATTVSDVRPADFLLLTTRTYDVGGVVASVPALLAPGGWLVAWQNGVGTDERLTEGMARRQVLAATLTAAVAMEAPGVVERLSTGGIALATLTGTAAPDDAIGLFTTTGLPVVALEDARALRWSKLLLNMLGAATSAILDLDMSQIVDDPHLWAIERTAFLEACRVMDAAGIKTIALPGYPVPLARRVVHLPAPLARAILGPRLVRSRGGRSPGARADLHRGRSELGDFHGAVARLGAQVGVRTPVNGALADLVLRLVADEAERRTWRGDRVRLVGYVEGAKLGADTE